MAFTPAFRALSDRQIGMMKTTPFRIGLQTNVNTLSSLKSRDMVQFVYTANGVIVKPTANGKKLVAAVKQLNQKDYFETRKDVAAWKSAV